MAHKITGFHCWLLSGRELCLHISLGTEEGWITGLCSYMCWWTSGRLMCLCQKNVESLRHHGFPIFCVWNRRKMTLFNIQLIRSTCKDFPCIFLGSIVMIFSIRKLWARFTKQICQMHGCKCIESWNCKLHLSLFLIAGVNDLLWSDTWDGR